MRISTNVEQRSYHRPRRPQSDVVNSGYRSLDAELPSGGWPTSGVLECVTRESRALAFQLMLPALAALTQSKDRRWLVLVAPPFLPSTPGLLAAGVDISRLLIVHPDPAQGIDAIETLLANGNCAAVLAWPMAEDEHMIQRLTEAAELGNSLSILFRGAIKRKQPMLNVIRVALHPADDALLLDIQQAGMRIRKMACQIPYTQLYQRPSDRRMLS